jgi:hypothetical protein
MNLGAVNLDRLWNHGIKIYLAGGVIGRCVNSTDDSLF